MAHEGTPFACLTCYDAVTARWLTRAGVHVLLVGDTAAEMVLGLKRTIDAPLDFMLELTAGVKRGSESAGPAHGGALVMGDMPFMSYQCGDDEGVRHAGLFLTRGLADVVKVEADESHAPLIARMVRAGVPVCGHIGSRPQRAALTGGYASAGRTPQAIRRLVGDAAALRDAGCSLMLIEAVPEEATQAVLQVTRPAGIPLIGIGAGPACDGQVLVWHDLAGLSDHAPSFAQPAAALGEQITAAGRAWAETVARRGAGPSPYAVRA